MKTRGEFWGSLDFYTQSISEQSRKLAFAAAAICWFFRGGEGTEVTFPVFIITALLFIVLFFTSDLSQYLSNAIKLERWTYKQEARIEAKEGRHAKEDDEMINPPSLYRLGDFFFYAKLVCLFLAFLFLIIEFATRLF